MPLMSGSSVDIDNVEAEITGAARDAERAIGGQRGPSQADLARQIRELMAHEAWRAARLSAD